VRVFFILFYFFLSYLIALVLAVAAAEKLRNVRLSKFPRFFFLKWRQKIKEFKNVKKI
jgi:hypothetical protein